VFSLFYYRSIKASLAFVFVRCIFFVRITDFIETSFLIIGRPCPVSRDRESLKNSAFYSLTTSRLLLMIMPPLKGKIDSMLEDYLVDAGKYYAKKKGKRASPLELENYKKNFTEKVNKYIKEFEVEVSEKLKSKDWDKEFNKFKNKEDVSSKDKWIRHARSNYIEKLYSRIWKSLKKSFISKYNKEPQEKDFMEFPKIASVHFYRKVLESLRMETVAKESKLEEGVVITRYGFHGEKYENIDFLINCHHEHTINMAKNKNGALSNSKNNNISQKTRPKSLNPFLQIIKQGGDSKKPVAKRLSDDGNDRENIKVRKINKDLL
jgi:hypothetical protein